MPWKKPCIRVAHCREKAAIRKLKPTLPKPYFCRKVMRKPKPMKIITWTSWKPEQSSKQSVRWWRPWSTAVTAHKPVVFYLLGSSGLMSWPTPLPLLIVTKYLFYFLCRRQRCVCERWIYVHLLRNSFRHNLAALFWTETQIRTEFGWRERDKLGR